jgi:hypothetical protein
MNKKKKTKIEIALFVLVSLWTAMSVHIAFRLNGTWLFNPLLWGLLGLFITIIGLYSTWRSFQFEGKIKWLLFILSLFFIGPFWGHNYAHDVSAIGIDFRIGFPIHFRSFPPDPRICLADFVLPLNSIAIIFWSFRKPKTIPKASLAEV